MTLSNSIAIAGNPNSGKTTAFNWYTGARQHVGNYPGITVEKKDGIVHLDGQDVVLIDLPGTYSLTAYSLEEVVARDVLAKERPGAVIDVINAGVLDRNLYLSVQMMEMGTPLVFALNMMDEAVKLGYKINIPRLEELTGIKCFSAVARKGEGLKDALKAAVNLAAETNGRVKPLDISYGTDLDLALQEMIPLVEEAKILTDFYPSRWVALKYLEGDKEVIAAGSKVSQEIHLKLLDITKKVTNHLRVTLDTYPEAVIADYRYGWIKSILRNGVLDHAEDIYERTAFSDKLDTLLTHRFLGPVILLVILYFLYFTTIELGAYPSDWLNTFFSFLAESMGAIFTTGFLHSLVTDGVIVGVGQVLSFVPLIMIMFFFISVLEDSGYMARVAYMMDRVFRIFGLHGASIMPFIVGGGIAGGCAVPGVMATRTLRSPKERLATILTVPFMICGAKINVFLLFVSIFFQKNQALYMLMFTVLGWAAALLMSWLLRSTLIRGEPTPFVMELPPYRLPLLSGVIIHTVERTWQYIKKAGTVILAISILLWAGMSYPGLHEEEQVAFDAQIAKIQENDAGLSEEEVEASVAEVENQMSAAALEDSFAGRVGRFFEPITKPAGFNWQTNIALIGGIAAKEVVISTLGTAYSLGNIGDDDTDSLKEWIEHDPNWTIANCMSLLMFTLLYSPCFVTLLVIKQETGKWRWLFFSLFFDLALALGVAIITNQVILWYLA
ncbi:MAG: ferrous iron transport protein B [Deltaproteobacteria bacterium]|nr:ferrous iron transport protein B [Deltaproteobacteria bacterium]